MRRRHFVLAGLGTVGALGIGWSFLPPRGRLRGHPLATTPNGVPLNGWVRIGTDDSVTVIMSKAEMGQGVHTALAQILADELDADWAKVRIEMSSVDAIYNNTAAIVDGLPFRPDDTGVVKRTAAWYTSKLMRHAGIMITGGSSTIKDLWLPMRTAGASARAMLVNAAATLWNVPAEEIKVTHGRVTHRSGRDVGFGALVEIAATLPVVEEPVLKTPQQFTLIGTAIPRIERDAKQRGEAVFGLDVVLPRMQYASVVMNPSLGGGVRDFDLTPARREGQDADTLRAVAVDGYNGGTAGVAVIADTPWEALRASRAVRVEWEPGPLAGVSSEEFTAELWTALNAKRGFAFQKRGNVDEALASAAMRIDAEYSAPMLAHMALEPMNCTVLVDGDRATVWASTQAPSVARAAVAKVLDLPKDRVDVRVQLLGGGFGRRLDVDYIAQAARVAAERPGIPVQTFWSREEDTRHDFYRPACVARFTAGLDANQQLVAWKNVAASQSIVGQSIARYFGLAAAGPDKTMIEGAFDKPYEWPNARVAAVKVSSPIPVGSWRSVGHSHQAFFTESFMDEVAHAAGADPVQFRLDLLKQHPRHARVLARAAELAGWGAPLAPARGSGAAGTRVGRGVALHQSFGSIVAEVAEVEVSAAKEIRVRRVVAVVDCGYVVNPGIVRQQIEGGVVFGLSAALHGAITFTDGKVDQSNFHDAQVLRNSRAPKVEVDIIPSDEHPEGVGEPGVPPLAPAVANAIFAATGQRLRSLPLKVTG